LVEPGLEEPGDRHRLVDQGQTVAQVLLNSPELLDGLGTSATVGVRVGCDEVYMALVPLPGS
jgi:hypothetical protein